jgi:hypothetical protein
MAPARTRPARRALPDPAKAVIYLHGLLIRELRAGRAEAPLLNRNASAVGGQISELNPFIRGSVGAHQCEAGPLVPHVGRAP